MYGLQNHFEEGVNSAELLLLLLCILSLYTPVSGNIPVT
jgi:hypothetical protein